jgi:hypothetical protein
MSELDLTAQKKLLLLLAVPGIKISSFHPFFQLCSISIVYFSSIEKVIKHYLFN